MSSYLPGRSCADTTRTIVKTSAAKASALRAKIPSIAQKVAIAFLSMVLMMSLHGVFASNANAQEIESLTAKQLERVLENAGLSPNMRIDSKTGAPVAIGKVGEFNFVVRSLNCSGTPKACSEFLLFANFPLGRALSVNDMLAVNNYNESNVFGRAYVLRSSGESGEVGIDYVIELGGGVSMDHIESNLSRWGDVVAAFIQNMVASPAAS